MNDYTKQVLAAQLQYLHKRLEEYIEDADEFKKEYEDRLSKIQLTKERIIDIEKSLLNYA